MTAVDRLFALEQFGIKLGLENIRCLLDELGHPEQAWPSIHIAGTNGKGSVAAMVERALRAAGRKTGRYTSPHLDRIEERVALDGQDVDTGTFEAVTGQVLDAVDRLRERGALTVSPTFFEVSTAVAFEIFRRRGVNAAVIEVGLGGRFDATNVVSPAVTAITSIAFDHERHLGHTLSEIAFEKAGIAKPGVPLVVGRLPQEAAGRVAEVAAAVGAPIVDAHARSKQRTRTPITPALAGRHQLDNAAVAIAILECWSDRVSHVSAEDIEAGLTKCDWPARLEWLSLPGRGRVLLDAAHNPAGAQVLASYLQDMRVPPLPIVFAAMADKNLAGMIAPLVPAAAMFVATTAPGLRARPAEQLAADIRSLAGNVPVTAVAEPLRALERAWELSPDAVAAGSIYMIGPLRALLISAGAVH